MSSTLLSETTLGLAAAARRLPPFRNGRPVSPSTIWRWITEGVKLPDGRTVRLEGARIGARWVTSAEALARFVSAQTPDLNAAGPQPQAPSRRQRAAERAGRELERLGI
jgi:hypothetical protein